MKTLVLSLLIALVAFTGNVSAQTVAQPTLAVGQHVRVPGEIYSLPDLLDRTAGRVSPKAVERYGSAEKYLKETLNSRRGKALEAVASHTVNTRMKATGQATRWVPTSVLGQPHHAADILEVDASTGKVLRRIQAKSGSPKTIINALSDPKYRGMHFLTDAETYRALERELKRKVYLSRYRGIPLSPEYARLKQALEQGRVMSKLPCGAPLPKKRHLEKVVSKHVRRCWSRASKHPGRRASVSGSAKVRATASPVPKRPRVKGTASATAGRVRPRVSSAADDALGVLGRAGRMAKQLGRALERVAGPVGVAVEIGTGGLEVYNTEKVYREGRITHKQRLQRHAQTAGRAAGGAAGAWAGAKAGGVTGAAIGSFFGPIGTAIGGGVGAIVGGIGGAWAGEKAGEAVAGSIVR